MESLRSIHINNTYMEQEESRSTRRELPYLANLVFTWEHAGAGVRTGISALNMSNEHSRAACAGKHVHTHTPHSLALKPITYHLRNECGKGVSLLKHNGDQIVFVLCWKCQCFTCGIDWGDAGSSCSGSYTSCCWLGLKRNNRQVHCPWPIKQVEKKSEIIIRYQKYRDSLLVHVTIEHCKLESWSECLM